jgi:DinB superfamily
MGNRGRHLKTDLTVTGGNMEFEIEHAINILNRTPTVLKAMLHELPLAFIQNNEGENTWSPFDVVGHLIYGEQVNWIPRAKTILEFGMDKPFEPFDRFAQFEVSKGKTIEALLEKFEILRQQNILTLREMRLNAQDLEKLGNHPEFGGISLAQLLATWVAHDLDHIVQISRVMAKNYRDAVGPWQAYLSVLK